MYLTSGTYNSLNQNVEILIRKAYQRVGIADEMIVPQQLDSALNNINLLLEEWAAQDLHLWTLQTVFYPLYANQGSYPLPIYVNNITHINLILSSRQLNGVAFGEGEGVYENAFNNDPDLSCTQTEPNGFIAYRYSEFLNPTIKQNITLLGITSNKNAKYTIVFEYTNDGINWIKLIDLGALNYAKDVPQWFKVPRSVNAVAYRIKETGGATLDINKLYFNNSVTSTVMSEVSREEFLSYSQPDNAGRPVVYYFNRQIQPILNIWLPPTPEFNLIQVSQTVMMQDAGLLATNTLDIPARFYNALVFGLAHLLSIEYMPEKTEMLKNLYDQTLNIATRQDTPTVPIKIELDDSKYLNNY